ncbi:MAG TPA: amino acid ABC transporter permease, partial [Mesotoga infera]|nr:amino acid ABC transporter permease [Mesotoga infera]
GTMYVWFFRNMPLLVIILLVYYGFGSAINIDRFWAGVVSLSLFEGAYVGEIFRAGIEAVPAGEIEAGEAMGLYRRQIMFSIIFPQAFRISIPPLIGQLVSLVKDSSLVSVIALGDLTMRARQVGTQTLAVFESYIALALCYLLITSTLSFVGRALERKMVIP